MQPEQKKFTWRTGHTILAYHGALVIIWPFYFYYDPPGIGMVVASAIMFFLTGIGITAGYHRFYSHGSYEMTKPAEFMILSFGTLGLQNGGLKWSNDHRPHHTYVDTGRDPYNIKKGGWYAHWWWTFDPSIPIDPNRCSDLLKNRMLMFQNKHAAVLGIGGNIVVSLFIGWLLNDYVGAFVFAWLTRMLVSHHATFTVNSLSHMWGERSYVREISAVDNWLLGFLPSLGEGPYHNFHHAFPSDYRNGHQWFHIDPTKWVIWTMSTIGLAYNLRRTDDYTIMQRLVHEDRKLMLKNLQSCRPDTRVGAEERIQTLAERMTQKLAHMRALAAKARELRKDRAQRPAVKTLQRELKFLRSDFKPELRSWKEICSMLIDQHQEKAYG